MAPQSTEALAALNKAIIEDAIKAHLSATYPVPPTSGAAPKEPHRMSDNGAAYNGQYRELRADVENLKVNFSELRHDIDGRFVALSGEVKEIGRTVGERFDTLFAESRGRTPDIGKAAGVVFGAISLVLTLVWGYSTLTQANTNTNILFTNEKIATQAGIVRDEFAATNSTIRDLASTVKDLRDTTIPRAELEYRLSSNRDAINKRVEKDVLTEVVKRYDSEIAAITADLIRLKDGQVSRAEHEQHWKQYDDRLSLISNRLVELGRLTSGASANDQIKQLQDQLQALQNKFILAPK